MRTGPSLRTNLVLMRAFARSPDAFLNALRAAGAAQHPIRIGTERVLLLDDAADVWELLTVHAKHTRKGRGMDRARLLLGEGLLTSEGERHRDRRRLLQPAFHVVRHPGYAAQLEAAAEHAAARWRGGDRLDLVAEMSAITLEAAGAALFGADLREPAPRITAALTDLLTGFRLAMAPGGAVLLRSPLPAAVRVRRARATLAGVVDDLAGGRWATGAPAPVLDRLAAEPGLTPSQRRDEIMTLLLAGHETTAMALSWALVAIDQEPDLRTALEHEWDKADPERPLTTAVVAETMRLWPPSWLFTRRVTSPFELGTRSISPPTMCLISPALLHRDGRWWREPQRFRPERWLREGRFDARASGQPRGAYLPFGAGPRMCIGEQLAWLETAIVLASLGRGWRLRVAGRPATGPSSMTLRPAGVVWARADRR